MREKSGYETIPSNWKIHICMICKLFRKFLKLAGFLKAMDASSAVEVASRLGLDCEGIGPSRIQVNLGRELNLHSDLI